MSTCLAGSFLVILGAASGCMAQKNQTPAPAPPAVVVSMTQPNEIPALVRRGVVSAAARYRLGFNVPGVLATLCCRTGDKVKQGQLLATLRGTDAGARLQAANAARSKAERDVATTSRLVSGGALAPNLDKEARDQLEIAEAQALLAREAVHFTRLSSPVDGTVQQRFAEVGEAVGHGSPVLLVEEVGRLVVRVGVLQEELSGIVPGAEVGLKPDGRDTSLTGKVSSVAPVPEATDGLFTVEVSPNSNADAPLVPGALVSVSFKSTKSIPVVKIPNDSLVERNNTQGVFVLDGGDSSARATFRAVKIHKLLGKDVWVTQGLLGGERIIAEGAYFIEDGEIVHPMSPLAGPND